MLRARVSERLATKQNAHAPLSARTHVGAPPLHDVRAWLTTFDAHGPRADLAIIAFIPPCDPQSTSHGTPMDWTHRSECWLQVHTPQMCASALPNEA